MSPVCSSPAPNTSSATKAPGNSSTPKKTLKTPASTSARKPALRKAATKRKRACSVGTPLGKSTKTMTDGDNGDLFSKITKYMDDKFLATNRRLDENASKMSEVSSSVINLSCKVESNAEEIAKLKRECNSARLQDQVEALVKTSLEKHAPVPSKVADTVLKVEREIEKLKSVKEARMLNPDRSNGSQEERHYWWSRRAVRVWPVSGTSSQQLWVGTGEFFFKNLLIPEHHLSEDSVESVRRIYPAKHRNRPGSAGRVRDEVRVLFKDVETRDMVYSYASNLADKRETAGMRLEVPSHLLGQFKTLERYGRHLKTAHGPAVKWHIRFDDSELAMFLNIKLSDQDQWTKIDFVSARDEVRSITGSETARFRERLSSSMSGSGTDPEVMEITPADPPPRDLPTLPRSATLQRFAGGGKWGRSK